MRRLLAVFGCLAALSAAAPACAETATESELKAAFLYNFLLFTEWPGESREYRLCIFDAQGALSGSLVGRSVRGRPLSVQTNPPPGTWRDCHAMYLPAADTHREAWQAAAGLPILTVSEGSDSPGMLRLFVEGGRMRFAADIDSARAAGLTLSSKLLRLARMTR